MQFKTLVINLCLLIFLGHSVKADDINTDLVKSIKLASEQKKQEALVLLNNWKTTELFQDEYKVFWQNMWGSDLDKVWQQYIKLKKQKKFIRLRLDLYSRLVQASEIELKNRKLFTDSDLKNESRLILKQLNGTSEGEIAESTYLKWIQKNKYYDVVCNTERNRWVTQPEIEFSEIEKGLSKCPLRFEDFLTRIRRLIFVAKEKQAQQEIEIYLNADKSLKDWEKAYIKAVFNSNIGDPLVAFNELSKFEDQLIETDFAENYFFISLRAGETEKSEIILNKIIQIYQKKNKNTNELLFQRGFLFYQNQRYEQAFHIFDKLYALKVSLQTIGKKKKHKHSKTISKDSEQIAWLRAWCLYLNKDYVDALKAFDDMRVITSDSSRLNYWIAMCYLRQNEIITALQIFKKSAVGLINNEVYTYYNLLSWIRYQDLRKNNNDIESKALIKGLFQSSKDRNSVFPAPSDDISRVQIQNLYSFILSDSNGDEQTQVEAVNDENEVIFSDDSIGIVVQNEDELKKHLQWAQFLTENNQSELAKWHLYEIEKNIKSINSSKLLIRFYTDHQFYYRALTLAQRQISSKNISFEKDLFFLKSVYPEAYIDDVLKFSKQRDIDPYFMLSIMKAETQYKSDSISPVGAVGLMQFMPYTLDKLSGLVEKNIKTSELFEPQKSIEYGAVYLKKIFLELQNQNPLTAAAYNGGPHRVKSWLKKLQDVDYDVFIEHIPFAETRTYVKRVLTFRSIYDKIYNKKNKVDDLSYLIKSQPVKINDPISLKEEWDIFKNEIKKTN